MAASSAAKRLGSVTSFPLRLLHPGRLEAGRLKAHALNLPLHCCPNKTVDDAYTPVRLHHDDSYRCEHTEDEHDEEADRCAPHEHPSASIRTVWDASAAAGRKLIQTLGARWALCTLLLQRLHVEHRHGLQKAFEGELPQGLGLEQLFQCHVDPLADENLATAGLSA